MLSKALVPLDGSEMAEGILPYVAQLAKGMNMPLVLFAAIDPDSIELPASVTRSEGTGPDYIPLGMLGEVAPGGTPHEPEQRGPSGESAGVHPHESGRAYASQIFEGVEERVKERLEVKARELRGQGLTVETDVRFGTAAEQIAQAARDHGCDLIAMSTHGRTAIGRGILGSVTDKVVHSVSIPTLTITPERAEAYWQAGEAMSKIMVPLDGSQLAEESLPYVIKIARALSLKVIMVRVAKVGGIYSAYADGYPYVGSLDLEKEIEDDAIEYLETVATRLRAAGLEVEWKLLRGNPTAAIVDLARETSQDIVALTTHGRSGFTRWILGSVAEGLIRASGDPVLVIPREEKE